MDSTPLVSVIIVNYNCSHFTLACVESLAALNYANFRIIVVENASTDDSAQVLGNALRDSDVVLLSSPENAGFAGGNNIGISEALRSDSDYVWLLNPDTEVQADALSALVSAAEALPDAGGVGSKIYYHPDFLPSTKRGATFPVVWGCGGTINVAERQLTMRGFGEIDHGQWSDVAECDYLPGCSMLVSCKVIREVGVLPEEYFMYFEETDWCARIRSLGKKLYYVPQSIVWHKFDDSKMAGPFTVYYYNRNAHLFWFRRSSIWRKAKLYFHVLLVEVPRARRALQAAENDEQRRIFTAHLRAGQDFLCCRWGKRSEADLSKSLPQSQDLHTAPPSAQAGP